MTFEELLDRDGRLIYKTQGISMLPMLHQNRDLVVIQKPREPLKRYDVVLYKRGPKYILHRIIKVRGTDFLIRGDNTYRLEIVPGNTVIGVLVKFVRKGKEIPVDSKGYRLYTRVWCFLYPLRAAVYPIAYPVLRKIKRAARRFL